MLGEQSMDSSSNRNELIQRYENSALTRRRMKQIVFTAPLACICAFWASHQLGVPSAFAGIVILYILITAYEKYQYGKSVLFYKETILKLLTDNPGSGIRGEQGIE